MTEVKIVKSTPEIMHAVTAAATNRRLVTFRTVNAIEPIEGADAIEVAVIGGWKVVTKKNEFRAGDPCVYFEIDSFLPDGVPAWQFLIDKSSRMFEGVKGHKLRTIKLRGQVSQGLILPLSALPVLDLVLRETLTEEQMRHLEVSDPVLQEEIKNLRFGLHEHEAGLSPQDLDLTALFGIKKWEAALPANLVGQAAGLFPSFIRKTDQERCQNLVPEIFGYNDVIVPFNVDGMTAEVIDGLVARGVIQQTLGHAGVEYQKSIAAKGDRNARYEVSMKLDGSSMTVFARAQFTEPFIDEDGDYQNPILTGVCSRNLQLKVNEENASNTFVATAVKTGLIEALEALADAGTELAVQGELMGPGIQGNRENLPDFQFFIFDIFDIRDSRYLAPRERIEMVQRLKSEFGVTVQHVPIIAAEANLLDTLGITNVEQLLAFAEGPSINNKVREGLVFKRLDGEFSFKAISNVFLAKEKE